MKQVHRVVQGKGGIGKNFVASLIDQELSQPSATDEKSGLGATLKHDAVAKNHWGKE